MKPFIMISLLMHFVACNIVFGSENSAGFYLPDSIRELTLRYRTAGNLIVLPVKINESISVNLILDTGCRNLVLFGKRFEKLLHTSEGKEITFSGLGDGKPVKAKISFNNNVSIQSIKGKMLPILLVAEKNLFNQLTGIDGVVGYEIFQRFEIEINPHLKLITFRPGMIAQPKAGFETVTLSVTDSRPVIESSILINGSTTNHELMIDTGSTLDLLLKTSDFKRYSKSSEKEQIGRGLNGIFWGIETTSDLSLSNRLQLKRVNTGIIHSDHHNHASIGMGVLKDYIVVLNYAKSYACFKQV